MESAIDKHLVCPRSISRRVPDEYQPPFPMFVARANSSVQQVTMCYFGVQYRTAEQRPAALAALAELVVLFGIEAGPLHHDLTFHEDNQGYGNLMAASYWRSPAEFGKWLDSAAVTEWWDQTADSPDGLGYFREVSSPNVNQFETLYAFEDQLPGVGMVMDGISGEVNEHGYWGSMRERFPRSQVDWMQPTGDLRIVAGDPASGGRVLVQGHDNIALIRSGQDWRAAEKRERDLYFDEIEPVLSAGMDFLRDNGQDVGCYSNRVVQNIDLDGNLEDETYNIGHWLSLEKLERWAESHPTHLRIFTTFFKVVADLDKLRLYHEVSVSDAVSQIYEYVNCHPTTGMMRDAVVADADGPDQPVRV